jgi:hypothetical protein
VRKIGRPFVYQSDEERPVTVSLRIPRDLYEQAQHYVRMRHPMTLTELLLDGLRLRLETPSDPRDVILSDDNTVMQEVQEMIRATVQAEIGKLNNFMGSAFDALKLASAPAAPAESVPAISHDGNIAVMQQSGITVMQEKTARKRGRRGVMREAILKYLQEHQEALSATELKVYLRAEKSLSDTLQGMVKNGILKSMKVGSETKYSPA